MTSTTDGTWRWSRRSVIGTLLAGSSAVALGVLDTFGGSSPAEADAPVCWDPSGFQYRGLSCIPSNYTTNCSKGGCFREGYQSSAYNCACCGAYNERHRTCGEDQTVNGYQKQYALRLNDCGDFYDGWEWRHTDAHEQCGCAFVGSGWYPQWSCNDGWIRSNGGGGWTSYVESICMQITCGQW